MQQRIGQASGAFNRLKPVWRSKKYSLKLKLRLFNRNVLSALLYSSECWKLNQQQERRILAFENNCLRRILNIDWREHVTNQKVRSISGQPRVTDVIRQRRWRYLGHVIRMKEDKIPRQFLEWQPRGTRRRGRPKNTLRRTYQRDLSNIHATIQPYGKMFGQRRTCGMTGGSSWMPWVPLAAQEDLRSKVPRPPPTLVFFLDVNGSKFRDSHFVQLSRITQ
ncbi:uncharacterized protein LOC136038401 [Artemia franciscana]|uniref:uncharacterized protein LOC136038401 n=1 Tax=Artemia franciscana TaxID=6661 RepID=UPI0032DBE233